MIQSTYPENNAIPHICLVMKGAAALKVTTLIQWVKFLARFLLAWNVLLVSAVSGCNLRQPVYIGFVAEISGRNSELGIELRNGVQMAVNEINASGGISGRKIELIIEDDMGNPKGARAAQRRLSDAGVAAVIGHFTSGQTIAGYEGSEEKGMVLLSATASTSLLSARNDLFFRTVASTDLLGRGLAEYICGKRGLAQVAIILDEDNQAYSQPMADAFTGRNASLGCLPPTRITFSSDDSPNFDLLVTQARECSPEGVLIIASPLNTAILAQAIAIQDWTPALFSSAWGQGASLIENGGKAVEGIEFVIGFDVNAPDHSLAEFKDKYAQHYTHAPMYTAMEGYETMLLLAEALELTGGSASGLSDALLSLKDFHGLTGPIRLDQYGDAVRPLVIQRVVGREFITSGTITLQE